MRSNVPTTHLRVALAMKGGVPWKTRTACGNLCVLNLGTHSIKEVNCGSCLRSSEGKKAKREACPGPERATHPCDRCDEAEVEIRISATDLDGLVLDYEKVCRQCATDAGFEVGERALEVARQVARRNAEKGGV